MKTKNIPSKLTFAYWSSRNQSNIFQHSNSDSFGYTIDVRNTKGKLIAIFRQSFSNE